MATGIKILTNGIEKKLDAMVKRSNQMDSYLNRNVYQTYQNTQRQRWMTENASFPSGTWNRLNPTYQIRKKKQFAQYDGGGQKMLIATGALYKDVIGGGDNHKKIVDHRRITISTTNAYAVYVDKERDFTRFPRTFFDEIKKDMARFVSKGDIG